MRNLFVPLLTLTAACAARSNGASPGGGDSGGGNVSFGGAQDIGDFRQILDTGGVPGPDTLDANGFFNEHYVAPPGDCAQVLCLTPGLSVGHDWLTGAHQATLQITVQTNVDPTQYHRLPLDVVAVIDRSGSMSQDGRLDKVKQGLHTMIDQLQDGDRLALVSFSDGVSIDAPLATLDRTALSATVDQLVADGGTDIFDGLQAGFQLLADSGSDRQRRVIFLSDGQANIGDTSQDDIIAMADGFVETGAGLTTIGVGADFDVTLMRGLAEHGAGNFYFVEDPAAATEVFSEELDYFMEPLALDVQIQAEAGGGYQFGAVTGSTLWTSSPSLGAMAIPAVFVASRTSSNPGETGGRRGGGSVLFVALQPTGHNGSDGTVANLTLTYRLPGGGDPVTQQISLAYPADPSATPDTPYLSNPEMAPRFAMYNMFLGLHAATEAVDPNCASAMLAATRSNAESWLVENTDSDLASDVELVDEYQGNLQATGLVSEGDSEPAGSVVTQCLAGTDPDAASDGGVGYDSGYEDACSAGGGNTRGGWLVMVGLAGLIAARRRSRR